MLKFSFFFSSRRRHTRCSRDWSSDVCSSDLAQWTGSQFDPIDVLPAQAWIELAAGPLRERSHVFHAAHMKIGRASCRERVKMSAVTAERKKIRKSQNTRTYYDWTNQTRVSHR